MPRIDPNQLLKCLSVLLSGSGGIKSRDEVQRLASLMVKFSKKLVSKCIYVLILKSTESDLLDMFMSAGGWDLTFNWLSDGIEMQNWPLVAELVELLLVSPVDIERLKGNNCPKVIKVLSKDLSATERVRELACNVVDQWLTIVKGACEASNTATSGNTDAVEEQNSSPELKIDPEEEESNDATAPRGVYKITIRDGKKVLAEVISSGTKPEENDNEVVDTEEKSDNEPRSILKVVNDDPVAKESLPPKKLAESRKQSLKRKNERKPSPEPDRKHSKDKKKITPEKKAKIDLKYKPKDKKSSEKSHKEKTPEEKAQEEKDKQNLMKLITPSIGGLGKIPKKSKDDSKKDDKKSSAAKPPAEPKKPFPKDPKKYNISIETRKGEDRPKTVKTFNSRFRSTGLEELPPPPKSSKKKEEVVERKPVKRSSPIKDIQPPEKKAKEEEKPPEKPIVPIVSAAPKPKISGLQESDVFADALTAANVPKDNKKKKRRTSVSSSPGDGKKESSAKAEEKEGKDAVKPVFKFYQDTLITSEEKGEAKDDKAAGKEDSPENSNEENLTDDLTDALSKEELEDEVAKAEEAINQVLKLEEKKNVEREKNRLPKGVLVYVRRPSKNKKSVSWKPEKELESIQFFELDETERVNVTKPFMDMKQMERINERILLTRKLVSEDIMEEKTPWRPLIPVDIPGAQLVVVPGKNSTEKDIQRARERTTLQAIYFNRSLIPDSPAEPDLEIHAMTDPIIIPLRDQSGDTVISYKDTPWPEAKGYPPGSGGSPPRMSPPPMEPPQQAMHGMPPASMYPPQFQQPPMQPFMPGPLMPAPAPSPDWMGNSDGSNMMVGGSEGMMMPPMNPGMHPGLLPTPDMYHMGGPPTHPDFMGPPFPMGGPPMGPPYQNGPPNYTPSHQEPGPRHQRPWFRGSGSGGGSWRHQSKSVFQNNKMCKYYMKKGICRQNNCSFRHGTGKGNIR